MIICMPSNRFLMNKLIYIVPVQMNKWRRYQCSE